MATSWAIYARQSLDRSGEGLAVERQIADCRALGKRQKLSGEPVVFFLLFFGVNVSFFNLLRLRRLAIRSVNLHQAFNDAVKVLILFELEGASGDKSTSLEML